MPSSPVEHQIRSFIQSTSPGVLCIKGRWGVGKTFTWTKWHAEELASNNAGFARSSYTSLFGLNSLDELRRSIFENTAVSDAFLATEEVSVGRTIGERFYGYLRKRGILLDIAMAITRRKDASEALFRAGFLGVRNQLVCFDDLERAGDKLPIRDVLGLASMLKEQRGCQVVLLLNDEQLKEEQRKELDRQLEKVVDISLIFDPSSQEAAGIALDGSDPTSELLRAKVQRLGITNIRVIKKVERLARDLERHLAGLDQAVATSAISTAVLAGWAHLQPDTAIPLSEIEQFNPYGSTRQLAADEQERRRRLVEYGFGGPDQLATAVIDGVKRGFFDADDVRAAGEELQTQLATVKKNPLVGKAFKLYHESLETDDREILNALAHGARAEIVTIDLPTLDGTLSILRRHRRTTDADRLVHLFIGRNENMPHLARGSETFDLSMLHDDRLKRAIKAAARARVDARDPLDVIRQVVASSSFNDEDVRLIRGLNVAQAEDLVRRADGPQLKNVIEWALRLARQPVDGVIEPSASLETAMLRIGARSPLRRERLAAWGVLTGGLQPLPSRSRKKGRRTLATWKAALKDAAASRKAPRPGGLKRR